MEKRIVIHFNSYDMNTDNSKHITDYKTYGIVLIVLLLLTMVSVWVTHIQLKAWSVAVALLVTCTMAALILIYFMHLKFDSLLIKLLVILVFLLFAIFVGITLLDYVSM